MERPANSAATDRPVDGAQRFEDFPLSRPEYMTVMTHFYRGEVSRSTAWRNRLDATTNWSVLTAAAVLSFSFSLPTNPHVVLLLSNLIILVYLLIEARRFRYFEVYRARVRMLEENFLIPVVTRQLESPMLGWSEMIAMDLDMPKFKSSTAQAIGFRLRSNYIWVFLIMLGGWLVKLMVHPTMMISLADLWPRMAVGSVPAWFVFGTVVLFYAGLGLGIWATRRIHGPEPTDEMAGLDHNLGHWKF